mmetsp:Transcript_9673/g.23803  ORF Transcript_9673/g.23803 Transcript_9673/m.23803 type:complete len:84 (+) Transcript_9673:308-559(+)
MARATLTQQLPPAPPPLPPPLPLLPPPYPLHRKVQLQAATATIPSIVPVPLCYTVERTCTVSAQCRAGITIATKGDDILDSSS